MSYNIPLKWPSLQFRRPVEIAPIPLTEIQAMDNAAERMISAMQRFGVVKERARPQIEINVAREDRDAAVTAYADARNAVLRRYYPEASGGQ